MPLCCRSIVVPLPIQWAIASGETVTGNTTMRIDAGLDTGDILLQEELVIDPDDTAVTLAARLAADGRRSACRDVTRVGLRHDQAA